MSLLVIMSMILVFMAVSRYQQSFLPSQSFHSFDRLLQLLSSLELFSIGTLTRMSVYDPGMVTFLTNSLFQMGCVRVEYFLLSCSLFMLMIY